jgi:hypothetical protein
MNHHITLDDDTSELLQKHAALTGLTVGNLIDRLLSEHLPELHELLALVSANPELHDQAANLLVSFGPDTLASGINRIAPTGYETLAARFDREMNEVIGPASTLLQ